MRHVPLEFFRLAFCDFFLLKKNPPAWKSLGWIPSLCFCMHRKLRINQKSSLTPSIVAALTSLNFVTKDPYQFRFQTLCDFWLPTPIKFLRHVFRNDAKSEPFLLGEWNDWKKYWILAATKPWIRLPICDSVVGRRPAARRWSAMKTVAKAMKTFAKAFVIPSCENDELFDDPLVFSVLFYVLSYQAR